MNITKEQLQQIRDALAYYGHSSVARPETTEALRVLDAALAAPEPQPVAWVEVTHSTHENYKFHGIEYLPIGKHNLYTAPAPAPQREWVGLTDEQENQFVKQLIDCGVGLVVPLYKIIEKIDTALKEKNHG